MANDRPASNNPLFDPAQDVVRDVSALQGVAHPLRLRLLGLLRTYGPSTATKLAAQCGESSGLASYHLRQLAEAGFVTDAEPADLAGVERSRGRERWWKAAQRSTYADIGPADDEVAAAVGEEYLRAVLAAYADKAHRWLSVQHNWPQPWRQVMDFSDLTLRLTRQEAEQLSEDIATVLTRYRRNDPAQRPGTGHIPADAVVVTAQYQVFPHPEQAPPAAEAPE